MYRSDERGSALVLVVSLAALLTVLGMTLLFTTDVDYRTSKNYFDRAKALSNCDAGLGEVIWRLNLTNGTSAPPTGSRVTVNSLSNYNAYINFDPLGVLTNVVDDDANGVIDDANELKFEQDWTTRILLTTSQTSPGSPWEYTDTTIGTSPWGSILVVPTVQPAASWATYTTADPASADTLVMRYMLDTDTALGDVEGDGAEIVFHNPGLITDMNDDKNVLNGLGGDGSYLNDSPYNITYVSGGTTYYASGYPVILVRVTGRAVISGRDVAKRRVEAEVANGIKPVYGYAVCACSDLKMSGGGGTDSYKSSEGAYGSGPVYANGSVGTNGNLTVSGGDFVSGFADATGSIDFGGSAAHVARDATAGGTIESGGVMGTSHPNTVPVPSPCDCTSVPLAAMVAAASATNNNANIKPNNANPYNDGTSTVDYSKDIYKTARNLELGSGQTIILPGGDYYFDSVKLSSSASVQIGTDSNGDGVVDGPPTTTVRMFVPGDFLDGSKGVINPYGRPLDLRIYISGTGATVSFGASTVTKALVYAPLRDVRVTAHAHFYGAIIGREVNVSGQAAIHYDEDAQSVHYTKDTVKLLAWREVQ